MRRTVALAILAIVATAPRAHGQDRTATTTASRGDYLRLPDFTCHIEALHEIIVHPWYGLPSVLDHPAYEQIANGSTLQSGKYPWYTFKFYVHNVGPVVGNLPEWSYTVTQNGYSVASFVNSGQKPPVSITVAGVAEVDNFPVFSTATFSPPLKPGLNKLTANFMARTPSDEISKSNNGCTFTFLIDY